MDPPREKGTPETIQIHRLEFGVDWPPGHAAAFLVEAEEPILVDAGGPGEAGERELREGLAARGREVGDVAHVLVTHPHTDHIGQLPALREAGARVHAPPLTGDRLSRDAEDLRSAVREVGRGAGLDGDDLAHHVDRALDSLERSRRLLPPGEIHRAYGYGEPFEVAGLRFDPVHTPGHQAGHAVFFCDVSGERVVFAGDALIETFRSAALHVGLDRGAYEAIDAFYEGYDRLAERSPDRVYPGHGPVFGDYGGVLADSRAALDDLLADVRRTLRTIEPASPVELGRERVPEIDHPAPLLDTMGALGTLEGRGEVRFVEVEGGRQYRRT